MAKRLTLDEAIKHCEEKTDCTQCGEEHRQLAEWLRELQKYKDLKEQDRLVVLPEGMNLRKLLDIITGHSINCPCDYNLVNRCELSCFECWLAALKGQRNNGEI